MTYFATRWEKNPRTPLISREKILGPPLNSREKSKDPHREHDTPWSNFHCVGMARYL